MACAAGEAAAGVAAEAGTAVFAGDLVEGQSRAGADAASPLQ